MLRYKISPTDHGTSVFELSPQKDPELSHLNATSLSKKGYYLSLRLRIEPRPLGYETIALTTVYGR